MDARRGRTAAKFRTASERIKLERQMALTIVAVILVSILTGVYVGRVWFQKCKADIRAAAAQERIASAVEIISRQKFPLRGGGIENKPQSVSTPAISLLDAEAGTLCRASGCH